MHDKLAPIVFFGYNRPQHTERVLGALMNNKLAEESILHIYIDGPKESASEQTIKDIEDVRSVVKQQKWCGEVYYHFAQKNKGCRSSIVQGITEMMEKYEKVIILEDDILTSPSFLVYMNKSLDYYEQRKSVFSISGYNFSKEKLSIYEDYEYDVFVSPRLLSWGWAIWQDRWKQIDWNWDFVPEFSKKDSEVEAFNRGGQDLTPMLINMQEVTSDNYDNWDVQLVFAHFQNHAVSILPVDSYVENIGFDGSGTHCIVDESMENMTLNEKENIRFVHNLYLDKKIMNAMYQLFYRNKLPYYKNVINSITRKFFSKRLFKRQRDLYV